MDSQQHWLRIGLFLTALSTLLLELLDARLLSVLAWYHLSFLAVSLAMLGMAAGAISVFRRGEFAYGDAGRRLLVRYAIGFSLSIPLSHMANLLIPMPAIEGIQPVSILYIASAIVVLTVPFFISGTVVTLILTRIGQHIGILYGYDLLGASCGCLLIVPLLDLTDITTAILFCGVIAGTAALCFSRLTTPKANKSMIVLGLLLLALIGTLFAVDLDKSTIYIREKQPTLDAIQFSKWNAYSYVVAKNIEYGPPFTWGKGAGFPEIRTETIGLLIDGLAGTSVTSWNGSKEALYWTQYDVTSLPYQLRKGDVAIVGVGGGRDVLSAIYGDSRSILGIEMNAILVELLKNDLRSFAAIADQKNVRLINDEARSYLTRSRRRYDIVQMSLIDTWAATGAGAYTLSENGLYTVEAWKVFLKRLKRRGILSVSRWFLPSNVSETSRLISLGVHTLVDMGVSHPNRHILLAARGLVATMLISPQPFSEADLRRFQNIVDRYDFTVLSSPFGTSSNELINDIVHSRSLAALRQATADSNFDYTAPTDARPYFFNMLKLNGYQRFEASKLGVNALGLGGVLIGNLRATSTLILLFIIAAILVCAIIIYPLLRSSIPAISRTTMLLCIAYFATIGAGFMSIQIPFLEIFSIYLGHPIYTFSVTLFSMILFAGIGSMLSDRLSLQKGAWHVIIPVVICLAVLALRLSLQPIIHETIHFGLWVRCGVVVALIAPISVLLGCCFPIGIRLVNRMASEATAFCWGINGAVSVLSSISAVGISLWFGIETNFVISALLYLSLSLIALRLARQNM